MPRKRRTPQEKKQASYDKDRRNVYGERGAHSRHAIARAKQSRSGRARAATRQAVDAYARDPELAERLEGRATVRTGGRWRKVPDEPLGDVLAVKLVRRARHGEMPASVAERKAMQVRGGVPQLPTFRTTPRCTATQSDVRRIALALPGVVEDTTRFGFNVEIRGKARGIAWAWLERIDPKKARVPSARVIGVRVPNLAQKDLIIASDPAKFFTEPHYDGYPAVLVRLDAIMAVELRPLIEEAWRCVAPKPAVQARVAAMTRAERRDVRMPPDLKPPVAKKPAAKKAPAKKKRTPRGPRA